MSSIRKRSLLAAGFAASLCAVFTVGIVGVSAAEPDLTVSVEGGKVRGIQEDGVRKFLGIPYAKPPVGNLRWRSPRAPEPWAETRDASKYGPTCAQNKRLGDFADASTSEDCLYINVFAAAEKSKEKRPVMVWIHGGGLFVGQSDGHNGSALVKDGYTVFVSFNYRLNVFGFLTHPALIAENKAVNYGLQDQQFALKWVRDNIDKFGGDPNNVTIFGESAGAFSTILHMSSPRSKGLFDRAIAESGGYAYQGSQATAEVAAARGQALAEALGCSDQSAKCLRKLPVDKLLAKEAEFFTSAVVDGVTLPNTVKALFDAGEINRVPFMNGTNKDEWRWFQAFTENATGHVIKDSEYSDALAGQFGPDLAPLVQKKYPLKNFNSAGEAVAGAYGDYLFACSTINMNKAASKYVNVYGFEFADEKAPNFVKSSFPSGAYHTGEIQYIFPGFKGVFKGDAPGLNKEQRALSRDMISYWTQFATKGNPNGRGAPNWPKFNTAEKYMSLNTPISADTTDVPNDHKCDFWNEVYEGAVPPK